METEDLIKLPASSSSDSKSDRDSKSKFNHELGDSEANGDLLSIKHVEPFELDAEIEEGQISSGIIFNEDAAGTSSIFKGSVDLIEYPTVTEKLNHTSELGENGCESVQDDVAASDLETDGTLMSGVKRDRIIFEEENPSVHIKFNLLPRDSIRKLEELFQQWSQWHARYCSSSHDPKQELQSGEKTYFPAINVGGDKASAVSFWMDNHMLQNNFTPLDDDSVPLYDRGYGVLSLDGLSNLEGGLELVDDSRCFNCGSYNHSFKECPKPRDSTAVNSARKQHKFRRNHTPGSRNPSRYYQSSPGGKFEGLRPGVLDAETRKLLGLRELEPPPWLNRMREIGYPPGYLVPDDESQPSGIVIYGDEDKKDDQEEGEILESDLPELASKKSVKFPGINAPIPENADKILWAARCPGSDPFQSRENFGLESYNRGRFREQWNARDIRDDSLPGSELGISSLVSSNLPRYTSRSSKGNKSVPRSPTEARSLSERSRNKEPPTCDSNSTFSHPSLNRRVSQPNNQVDDDHENHSSRTRDKDDRDWHRQRSGDWDLHL
ncbi:hypothetical protein Dimus_027107 [Dionaea muscipula]